MKILAWSPNFKLTSSIAIFGTGCGSMVSITAPKAAHKVTPAIIYLTLYYSGWETVNGYSLVLEIVVSIEV